MNLINQQFRLNNNTVLKNINYVLKVKFTEINILCYTTIKSTNKSKKFEIFFNKSKNINKTSYQSYKQNTKNKKITKFVVITLF